MTYTARHFLIAHPVVLICSSLCVSGCSWSTFIDIQDSAPAKKVTQEGTIESKSFGQLLLGMPRFKADNVTNGGTLILGGGNNLAINSVTILPDGSVSGSGQTSSQELDNLEIDNDNLISMARSPDTATESVFYLGSRSNAGNLGRVQIIAPRRWNAVGSILEGNELDFGIALAPGSFDDGPESNDLAIGSSAGRLYVAFVNEVSRSDFVSERTTRIELPNATASSRVSSLAAANLDPSTQNHEIVAGLDTGGAYVVYRVESCKDVNSSFSECSQAKVTEIPRPDGIDDGDGFGNVVHVVNATDGPVILISAPKANNGAGEVFAYTGLNFSTPTALADSLKSPTRIAAPTGASSFGKAIASGKFLGDGGIYVAISAPATAVENTSGKSVANAGKIYVYGTAAAGVSTSPELDADPNSTDVGAAFAEPVENDNLGTALAVIPYNVDGTPHALLAASGTESAAAFVFFASLTDSQVDVRSRTSDE